MNRQQTAAAAGAQAEPGGKRLPNGRRALAVTGLSVDLGGRRVLDRVDLSLAGGELVGLIGPNGAGKTTLLRAILGLTHPTAGQITIGERPSEDHAPDSCPAGSANHADRFQRARNSALVRRLAGATRDPVRRGWPRRDGPGGGSRPGYVPQRHEFAWDFPISVAGAVMTGLTGRLGCWRRPGGEDWRAVAAALERVRLGDLAERPIGQLSAGQRQRVLVARALAPDPAVLLLDEPFTGLDMPAQETLSELFAALAGAGRAVLLTTHDVFSALDVCDRIILLNQTVIAAGPPAAVAADAAAWRAAFDIAGDSAMLRALKAAAG